MKNSCLKNPDYYDSESVKSVEWMKNSENTRSVHVVMSATILITSKINETTKGLRVRLKAKVNVTIMTAIDKTGGENHPRVKKTRNQCKWTKS